MPYIACFQTNWDQTIFDKRTTYSECIHDIIKALKDLPLSDFNDLSVYILKGNLDYDEDLIKEKFDLTSWIEYKKKQ